MTGEAIIGYGLLASAAIGIIAFFISTWLRKRRIEKLFSNPDPDRRPKKRLPR